MAPCPALASERKRHKKGDARVQQPRARDSLTALMRVQARPPCLKSPPCIRMNIGALVLGSQRLPFSFFVTTPCSFVVPMVVDTTPRTPNRRYNCPRSALVATRHMATMFSVPVRVPVLASVLETCKLDRNTALRLIASNCAWCVALCPLQLSLPPLQGDHNVRYCESGPFLSVCYQLR